MENTYIKSEIFKSCSEEQIKKLVELSFEKKFKSGSPIFFEGDHAKDLCLVKSGRVKIFKMSGEGKEQVLHIFTKGEPFGEAALFAGSKFPANAEAVEDSNVVYLPRENLLQMFISDPVLPMNIIAMLSMRLKKFAGLIEDLSLKELPERLASYIIQQELAQGNSSRVILEFSKGQLAKILGSTQESLSRTLTKLTKAEIIKTEKREITILDKNLLNDLSKGIINIKNLT